MKAADDGFCRSLVNVESRDVKMTNTGVTPLVVVTIAVVSVRVSDEATEAGRVKHEIEFLL